MLSVALRVLLFSLVFSQGHALNGISCFHVLADAHANLRKKLGDEPLDPTKPQTPNQRLFIVQDYLLFAGEAYHEVMKTRHGIEPFELELDVKAWIDSRFQSVVAKFSRDNIRKDLLAYYEGELNEISADLSALVSGGRDRDQLIFRYENHVAIKNAEKASVEGIRPLNQLLGVRNPGVVIPVAYPPRFPPAPTLVPENWVPLNVSPYIGNTAISGLPLLPRASSLPPSPPLKPRAPSSNAPSLSVETPPLFRSFPEKVFVMPDDEAPGGPAVLGPSLPPAPRDF